METDGKDSAVPSGRGKNRLSSDLAGLSIARPEQLHELSTGGRDCYRGPVLPRPFAPLFLLRGSVIFERAMLDSILHSQA